MVKIKLFGVIFLVYVCVCICTCVYMYMILIRSERCEGPVEERRKLTVLD